MGENHDIERYLNRIGSQHRGKRKFMSLLAALLDKADAAQAAAKEMPAAFCLDTAVGRQLDILGEIVGVSRALPPMDIPDMPPLLDDTAYRQVLQSKIIQNQWDGTYGEFIEIYKSALTSGLDIAYHDAQDMTVSCNVSGTPSPIVTAMILGGYIVPKPAGVRMNISITTAPTAHPNASACIAAIGNAAIIRSHID